MAMDQALALHCSSSVCLGCRVTSMAEAGARTSTPLCNVSSSRRSGSLTSSSSIGDSVRLSNALRLYGAHRFHRRSPGMRAAASGGGEESSDRIEGIEGVRGRRQACVQLATLLVGALGSGVVEAAAAREVEVGTYLPPASDDRFVQFRATAKDTPALRAGNVQPYAFFLPPTWKQLRVANILSGNYCQPKCAEPWVEVKFGDAKQGSITVVAAPMVRLTNKVNASIEEIGGPDKILAALGPFVTGNTYDPDEVTETSVQHRGEQTYYSYELETPFAKTGAHNLATATAKGNAVMLFVVSASDSQWSASEDVLRSMLMSFDV